MTRVPNHCPECGCVLTKARSGPDHRRFFAIIQRSYENWPESHPEHQPSSAEHLRAWLLVTAGYHDVKFIPYPEEASDAIKSLFRLAVEATFTALDRARGYAFLRVSAGGVEILTPRSINFQTLSQREFAPIREAVESLVEAALGVTAQQLLRHDSSLQSSHPSSGGA